MASNAPVFSNKFAVVGATNSIAIGTSGGNIAIQVPIATAPKPSNTHSGVGGGGGGGQGRSLDPASGAEFQGCYANPHHKLCQGIAGVPSGTASIPGLPSSLLALSVLLLPLV